VTAAFAPTIPTIAGILAAMAIIALIEAAVPLHGRGRWSRFHVGPNLALTFLTFATNTLMNAALLLALFWLEARGFGLLRLIQLRPLTARVIVVVVLDFSFYVAHVAMHQVPAFWRYHRVHHADPAVDVTTSIRQHPGESVIRYAFMAAFAFAIGASPGAFAVYRVGSALNGLLEHADVRVPLWLDRLLSLVTTWPYMHKVHHSRIASEANTNYGNIVSFFDRLFGTFTPSKRGKNVVYGLDGFDDPAMQTTAGLLAMPFRDARASADQPARAGHHLQALRGEVLAPTLQRRAPR
jgi:sterol desaturase/sphingolipid hydroxylase (fatty acid hydroxylase superfamily)